MPVLALAGLALVSNPSAGHAQFGRRLKDAVKRTAEEGRQNNRRVELVKM